MKSAAVVGTVVYDQILTARSAIQVGACSKMDLTESLGGSMHNVAWNLSTLNVETHFITKLGNDALAIKAQRELEKRGCFVIGPTLDRPTPRFYLLQDAEKRELFCTITDDFFFHENDLLYSDAIRHAEWGITDQQDPAYLKKLFQAADSTRWILSGSLPDPTILSKLSGLILNEQEIQNGRPTEETAWQLVENGLAWVIVTRGKNGAVLYVKNGAFDYPLFSASASLNTLGCGDAFCAGVITALLEGRTIRQAVDFGIQATQLILNTPAALSEEIKKLKPSL